MKIALAQLNYCIGDFGGNTEKIVAAAKKANAEGADLVVFSELSVCGYFPFDCLEFSDFMEQCEHSLDVIAERCYDIPLLVGCPLPNGNEGQKPLFNAAVFLHQGKRQVFKKKRIGSNPLFDERKYFEPSHDEDALLEIGEHRLAVTVGDDLANWGADALLMEAGEPQKAI